MKIYLLIMLCIGVPSCVANEPTELAKTRYATVQPVLNDPALCEPNGMLPQECQLDMCAGYTQPCIILPAEWYDGDCDGVISDNNHVDPVDNCGRICNPDQTNSDTDHRGDVCDPCPLDPADDIDKDGVCGDVDNCPAHHNPTQDDVCSPAAVVAALQGDIAALESDVALLTAALLEIRAKYPGHFHGLLGLNGDPVGDSGELLYSLPGEP